MKSSSHKYDIKTFNCETRRTLCRIWEMHLKLEDQQLKIILFIYRLSYLKLMVMANQKSTINTHTNKKNQNTTLKFVIKLKEKRTKEEGKKTYKNKSKTVNRIATKACLSTITLNVNSKCSNKST